MLRPKGKRFRNRRDAGRQLASRLAAYADRPDVLVLGLPRGGVEVAFEVARALHLPLDAYLVRKLGVPGQEELAMGALAVGGVRVLNSDVVGELGISDRDIERVVSAEQAELDRRNDQYRDGLLAPEVGDRVAILVDDGLATGATMRAAIAAIRPQGPKQIVVAVPVAPRETCERLQSEADDVVCLSAPEWFYAISLWYDDFTPTSDEQVRSLLKQASTDGRLGL